MEEPLEVPRDVTFPGLDTHAGFVVVFVFVIFKGEDGRGGDANGLVVAFKALCFFFGDGVDGTFVAIGRLSCGMVLLCRKNDPTARIENSANP